MSKHRRENQYSDRNFGAWRVVVSAWAVAILFVMLFAGVEALASRHCVLPDRAGLAGAVIPRHDSACAWPAMPDGSVDDQCGAAQSILDRAQADAYTHW
jgi:hypothetical protein